MDCDAIETRKVTPQTDFTAEITQLIQQRNLKHIKLGVFDADGVMLGKYISTKKFLTALKQGTGFCDLVFGWDINDKLYENTEMTGWHVGYPDLSLKIIPESLRELPHENTLLFLCEIQSPHDALCHRVALKRMVQKAYNMGYAPTAAFEYEFFLFDETPHSVREKGYRNLKPISPGNFGYSMIRNTVFSEFHQDLLNTFDVMDIPLEGLHSETGPGVIEAAIAYDDALAAADKAALFKTYAKIIAQRHGWIATFMAKWSNDQAGCGGHCHVSLRDLKNKGVFFDKTQAHGMSAVMRHFLAGQQRLMPEMLALFAPTVNSYNRLRPGYWAPTQATWGVDNRTCALRVIAGSEHSQRIEHRVCGADANPYLALTAALGAGLWGIEHKLEPTEPIAGNAYTQNMSDELHFPATLDEAALRLKNSTVARTLFGDAFVDHFVATRQWEAKESRIPVTDWQLDRYFESI